MPSIYRVYSSPYGLSSRDAGSVSQFEVKNISSSWFAKAGISTRGSAKVTSSQVTRLQNVIYGDLSSLAGKLRYLENVISRVYGRNRTAMIADVKRGVSVYKNTGLTFNRRTYLQLYRDYVTMMDSVSFTAAILRSYTKSQLY